MSKILEPTMKLKWVMDSDCTNHAVTMYRKGGFHEDFYILKQWWRDDKGGGEWRPIEIDYLNDDKPPGKS